MNGLVSGCDLRSLPRTFVGEQGVPVQFRILPREEESLLLGMYLAYQPRNAFQGLPPIKDDVCARWVHEMVRNGVHAVARSDDKTIVGHVGLFPMNRRRCEMLIAVSPMFQNLGIGTELVHVCIDLAAELGFERIWLPVDATNVRARHVYEKCGFTYVSNSLARELDMTCDVLSHRRSPETQHAGQDSQPIAAPCFLGHATPHSSIFM